MHLLVMYRLELTFVALSQVKVLDGIMVVDSEHSRVQKLGEKYVNMHVDTT